MPCGKSAASGGAREVGDDVVVDERIQIATGKHDAPGSRDLAVERRRDLEPTDVECGIAQAIRVRRGSRMRETRGKSATAIGLQHHAGVVSQAGFGDGCVSGRVGQLRRHRRRCPLSLRNVFDVLPLVHAFVVSVEVVIPDRAARRKVEDAWLRLALERPSRCAAGTTYRNATPSSKARISIE